MQVGHPVAQLGDVHTRELRDVLVVHIEVQGLLVEAVAVALGALGAREELSGPLLRLARGAVLLLQLDIFHQTVVGEEVVVRAQGLGLDVEPLVGAVHDVVDGLVGHLVERGVEVDAVFLAYCGNLPEYEGVLVFSQWQDAPVAYRERCVGHDLVAVDDVHIAQALALVAGPLGRVEREVVRCRVEIRQPRLGVHQGLAVVARLAGVGIEYHELPVALLEGQLGSVLQALGVFGGHFQAVDHELHAVVLVAVELHAKGDFLYLAVDAHIDVALFAQLLKEVFVVTLAVLDQRGKDIDATAVISLENEAQYLLDRVFHHGLAREVAAGLAGARIEQAQVVVDLGGGAHSRARVFVGRLLPDRYHRVQARYLVYVGALEHAQHVAGIGRERLQIPPLSLGKDGVEGQRRLAAAAQPGYHREFVVRYLYIYVF